MFSPNRPFAQLLVWVRDGASGDGRSITCTWIAPRTARNGDKKSTSRPSETLKLHVGDWPTVTGCPVSNPGNNCANGLFNKQYFKKFKVANDPRKRFFHQGQSSVKTAHDFLGQLLINWFRYELQNQCLKTFFSLCQLLDILNGHRSGELRMQGFS